MFHIEIQRNNGKESYDMLAAHKDKDAAYAEYDKWCVSLSGRKMRVMEYK